MIPSQKSIVVEFHELPNGVNLIVMANSVGELLAI